MRFTIFTPTYNRGYIIEKLYTSLKEQTFMDFEWIVVDDGSTDNTSAIFQRILEEKNDFSIVYKRIENGGKHRAINLGVQLSKGEMFFIVDSDDYLPENALLRIHEIEKTIPPERKNEFAGVCGQKGYSKEKPNGKTFDGDILDITSLQRNVYGITGDKAEVFYTRVMKKYPFPEFEGEKFLTECVVWDKIANDGLKLRFFNEIVYICDYLEDGLSANLGNHYKKSPKGYGLYIKQSAEYGKIDGIRRWDEYLNYYRIFKKELSSRQIAKNLGMKPFAFSLRLWLFHIFSKLYR